MGNRETELEERHTDVEEVLRDGDNWKPLTDAEANSLE